MENLKKIIDGYECELDFSEEWSDCIIAKDGYSGSLQFLEMYGHLESYRGIGQIQVPVSSIKKIEKWALEHGY